jgi:hypothetical protein
VRIERLIQPLLGEVNYAGTRQRQKTTISDQNNYNYGLMQLRPLVPPYTPQPSLICNILHDDTEIR